MRTFPIMALACATLIAMPQISLAESENLPLQFSASPNNMPSVRQGARDFVNYCAGCHSLKYLRYNRLGRDAGISDDTLKANLIFPVGLKPTSHLLSGLTEQDGTTFFGKAPPDLSLEAEYRGAKWIYNYLHSFYLDPSRPIGVNNPLIPNVAMPNVLGHLQGWQQRVKGGHEGAEFKRVSAGAMTPAEFDTFVANLTNFLAYAATPEHHIRTTIAPFVLFYLLVLTVLCYLVKREFWKDVHNS